MAGAAEPRLHGAADGEADPLQGGETAQGLGSSPGRREEVTRVSSGARSLSSSSSFSSLAPDVESDDDGDGAYPFTQCECEEIPSFRWIASPLRWWKPKRQQTLTCLDPSNVNSRGGLSFPSTRTTSTARSSLSAPSYSGKSTGESLPTPKTEGEILSSSNLKAFTLSELKSATRNFRPGRGFGFVFKGWIDEHTLSASRPGSGMAVAVKNLNPEGLQGHKEWLTEVQYLGLLHHPNLDKLIGYCSEGDNQLLVYEFMPKGSLDIFLFSRFAQPLSWATRIKVAVAAARGLSFLHDLKTQVIHRNVKASNILLDAEFNAKLSDFGLAKDGPTGDMTHVSTQVMGTYGYAAPGYIATGRLSAKADVYSFGVVLLELLLGRRVVDKSKAGIEQNLVDWAKLYLGDKRKLCRVMDTRLEGRYPKKGAFTVASVALQCLGKEAKLRPRMSEVLAMLEQLQDA